MRARVGVALALGALALACAGGPTPAPQYFTLAEAAAPDVAPIAARPELGLVLGALELPRHLDRDELVTRSGPHELVVWNRVRWAGSLRGDIQRVLADDLARLLGTARIATYPVEARFPVDCRVQLELLELGSRPGEPVLLRARYVLAGADGRALEVGSAAYREAPASSSWEDYVAAHRAALARLAQQLALRIDSLR
jgi:hypothetical protein